MLARQQSRHFSNPLGSLRLPYGLLLVHTDQENGVTQASRVVEATVSQCADSFFCLWENTLYLFDNVQKYGYKVKGLETLRGRETTDHFFWKMPIDK